MTRVFSAGFDIISLYPQAIKGVIGVFFARMDFLLRGHPGVQKHF